MRPRRPVNLNLLSIRLPITAIASILHRLTGMVLLLCIPALVWIFNQSLASPEAFAEVQSCLTQGLAGRLILAGFLLTFAYHCFAGIRHLLMDIHIGETLKGARLGVWLLALAMALTTGLLVCWLWR